MEPRVNNWIYDDHLLVKFYDDGSELFQSCKAIGWEAGMLGCYDNIERLGFQAFQPPSFRPIR
jgi:hypothetical protein